MVTLATSVLAIDVMSQLSGFGWGIVFIGTILMFALSIYQLYLLRSGERSYGIGLGGQKRRHTSDFPPFPPPSDYDSAGSGFETL